MKWLKLIKVAFSSITKNKLRSLLTMLGIIIGVGSVIALVSLGQGSQADIEDQVASLGTNLLIISPGSSKSRGISRGAGSLNSLTMKDVDTLKEKSSYLQAVSPIVKVNEQVIAAGNNWQTSITGVSPEYLTIRDWKIESGSFFEERAITVREKVAVLGKTVANELFPNQNPIGAKIRIRNVPFTVVGVLSEKGQSSMGTDQDDIILAPATSVLYRLSDGQTVNTIMASAVSSELMTQATGDIQVLIREQHRLKPEAEDDFTIRDQTEINAMASKVMGTLTLLLGTIAGVSLLVGGIGIMNIMLVSVTERTREIGIRLAIGARGSDVLIQFLIEAVILSLTGGLIGVLSGIGIAWFFGKLLGISLIVNPVVVAIATVFAGAIGVFFGFYPARKAANLNPIDALRYE